MEIDSVTTNTPSLGSVTGPRPSPVQLSPYSSPCSQSDSLTVSQSHCRPLSPPRVPLLPAARGRCVRGPAARLVLRPPGNDAIVLLRHFPAAAVAVAGVDMDILKREISRKRQQLEEKELVGGNKKYFKRSELAKKEEEAYFQRCGYKVQQQEEEEKPLTSSNPVLELELAEEKLPMTLSRQEVIRRLRERGEPIRLFGETDYDAFQRLRKIEILAPEVNKGLRNDLKAALDKIDQQYLNEIVGGQEAGDDDSQNDLKVHEENTTIEELEALGESLGRGDDHYDMDIITKFLKFLLGVWAKELNAREDYVKRGVQGKLNSATQKQTESYLRPLFRKLRKRTLPADIKESITDIIKFMLQREYVKANDAYLQMAIGNAPWPIGVTMVGIHARTGREKIFSKHVAHVLNDETQRKYIQGLKRLMTICQKHFPTDPSKCVEYNAL